MGSVGVNWREIHPASLVNLQPKGNGSGANVYKATLPAFNTNGEDVSVALRKPRITSMLALNRFEHEVEIRSRIAHPNLLPLVGAWTSAPDYCTVSPWMDGGTLFNVLHAKAVHMSFERLVSLSLQFAKAMAYMHQCNLVHRDLKTANLLLDERWQNLFVADLDLAIDVNDLMTQASTNGGRAGYRGPSNGRLSHMVGTLVYMAPEVLSGKPHTFAADVYAFGITVNEMATCSVPFVDRKLPVPELHTVLETRFNEVKLRGAIVKNHLRPVLATGVPDEFREMIKHCWHPDPSARPTFPQIVEFLEATLRRGQKYLSLFSGSTFDVDGHLAGRSENLKIGERHPILREIRAATAKPRKPIWELVKPQKGKSDGGDMDVDMPSKELKVTSALSSTCGQRGPDRMEDRSLVIQELAELPNTHLFGVFDGHAGQGCADFVVNNFPGALYRAWTCEEATPESALIHAFEDVDMAFLESTPNEETSGCTALAALIVDETLYVANAGDCRCVIANKDGFAMDLSRGHVGFDPAEKVRVEARGGFISMTGRVQGRLMVTRAMGDRPVKRYICSTPEVTTTKLTKDNDFIILASDGLWDVVSSQAAVDLVRTTVRVPDMAAKRLAMKAIELGSDDNISVIVAFFGGNVSFDYLRD